jgi:hypothetical protein
MSSWLRVGRFLTETPTNHTPPWKAIPLKTPALVTLAPKQQDKKRSKETRTRLKRTPRTETQGQDHPVAEITPEALVKHLFFLVYQANTQRREG